MLMHAAKTQKGPTARHTGAAMVGLLAAAAALAFGGVAAAQSASSTASQFGSGSAAVLRNGYSTTGPGEFNRGIDVSTRDANGNKVFIDGVTQVGSDQSVFARQSVGGAFDTFSGAGVIGGNVFGNSLNVTMPGRYGTVTLNTNQLNNGDNSASSVLNGKVNLDGQ